MDGVYKASMNQFSLKNVFKSGGLNKANFLSRIFGLFNEEPVRFWAEMESTPYDYLGRPTLYPKGERGRTTLDFAFRRKSDGSVFVAEMKCEIAYQNYRFMTLTEVKQVQRHLNDQAKINKKSFARFVESATRPDNFNCRVTSRSGHKREITINGSILVWGDVYSECRDKLIDHFGFGDILSVQDIINDLITAKDPNYLEFMEQRSDWSKHLFDALSGK